MITLKYQGKTDICENWNKIKKKTTTVTKSNQKLFFFPILYTFEVKVFQILRHTIYSSLSDNKEILSFDV
jgi:hypothetical protein